MPSSSSGDPASGLQTHEHPPGVGAAGSGHAPAEVGAGPSLPGYAALALIGGVLGREVRRFVARLMFHIAFLAFLLVMGVALALAGLWRLTEASAHACTRWLGDPIMGEALVGVVLLLVPLIAMLLVWRRVRR